jgi:hypothetical protein
VEKTKTLAGLSSVFYSLAHTWWQERHRAPRVQGATKKLCKYNDLQLNVVGVSIDLKRSHNHGTVGVFKPRTMK